MTGAVVMGIQKQIENPDCVVTTEARSLEPNRTVIWLRRDDRVPRFYRGETNRLDLVPNVPIELETDGLITKEPRIEAWGDGQAVIRVPNNPKAPAKHLTLTVYLKPCLPSSAPPCSSTANRCWMKSRLAAAIRPVGAEPSNCPISARKPG